MSSIKDLSMTKRNKVLGTLTLLLRTVYNRLKEKSNKNRMVKELSTNKNKFSQVKVKKYLNNNPEEAQRILDSVEAQGAGLRSEQATNIILSNITDYTNLFDIPFESGIPTPSPTPTPSETPKESPESAKARAESMKKMEERLRESKQSQSQRIEQGQEQYEAPNPQVLSTSAIPTPTQEAQEIEQEQRRPIREMTMEQLESYYQELTLQLLTAEREERANIKRLQNMIDRRRNEISRELLREPVTTRRVDRLNRNNETIQESSADQAPRDDSEIRLGQPAEPEAGAGGDPIQDAQDEAITGGSERVEQSENINRQINYETIGNTIREGTKLNERSINDLANTAPASMRNTIKSILKGNVTADNIIRGVVSLGLIYSGVSPANQSIINAILDTANRAGFNVDKYLNKTERGYTARIEALRSDRLFLADFIEGRNQMLRELLNEAISRGFPENEINLDDILFSFDEYPTDRLLEIHDPLEIDVERINSLRDVLREGEGRGDLTESQIEEFRDEIDSRIRERNNLLEEYGERLLRMPEAEREERKETREKVKKEIEKEKEERRKAGAVGAGAGIGTAYFSNLLGAGLGAVGAGVGGAIGGAVLAGRGLPSQVVGGVAGGVLGGLAEKITREPITLPADTLKVVQQEDRGTGKARPKFIIPSDKIFEPTKQQVQADIDEWNMFDFVNPTSEGANGTVTTNPLKLQALQEKEVRFRDAGVDVHPIFWNDLPYNNQQVNEMFLGPVLPPLPEMKFQENEEEFFDSRGMPQLSMWGKNGGYNPSSQAHAIAIQSAFRHGTEVTQLDEDINKSILYGQIPMPFPKF